MLKTKLIQSHIAIGVSLFLLITASITTVKAADTSNLPRPNVDLGIGIKNNNMPKYYPAVFQRTGKIFLLGASSITITGSSKGFSLSPNILVHSMSTEFSSRKDLSIGQEVGFSFVKGMDGQHIITEIWILPSGTLLVG